MPDKNYTKKDGVLKAKHGDIVYTEFVPESEGITPCVILSHGFNSCIGEVQDVAEVLAEHGIYALCYDFNGGGNKGSSTGKTTDMSVLTEQDDLREIAGYVKSRPQTGKIYLYGESQGGFVTALTAPEMEYAEGLYLVYPAFVIPDDWLSKDPETMKGEFDFMGVKLSKTYFDGVPRYDVLAKAAEFKKGIRIWHGSKDDIVDPEYSLRLIKLCDNCELTVVSGLGHWFPPELRKRIGTEIAESISAKN